MLGMVNLTLSAAVLKFSFASLLVSTFGALMVSLYCWSSKKKTTATSSYFYMLVNYWLTIIMVGHAALFVGNFYFYLKSFEELSLLTSGNANIAFKNFSSCNIMGSKFSIDLYGFVLLLLAFFVGFFALLSSESKIKHMNTSFFFYFNYFLLIVYVFVTTNDVFTLFICYELLLIPSFFFVFFISYTRKAMQASLYFVI